MPEKTQKATRRSPRKKASKADKKEKAELVAKMQNNVRLSSEEFQRIEDELIMVVNKLSQVGLQEYATYLDKPWRILWSNFLAGTARGLGFLFGAAIIIAIASFVLSFLIDLPIIGEFFQNLNDFLEHNIDLYNNT